MPTYDSDLLSRIPLTARSVLCVGCDGELAAAYRAMNPKARVSGSEPAPPSPDPGRIDCIVYDGFLEHTADPHNADPCADPWAMLARHADALAPQGTIVLRTRNAAWWRATEHLLRGTAEDTPAPIGLDAGLIRRRLAEIGLIVADVHAQEDDPDAALRFAEAITPGLAALGINPAHYRQRCLGSHLIWRLRKAPVRRISVSGSMLDPVGGVSHVRVVHPLHALASDPAVTTIVTDRIELAHPDGIPRIFVLHRPALLGERGKHILSALSEAGYLIVTEFDDHPDHFAMMRAGGELTFTGVHAVQTSTPRLAEELRKYNPEIAIFPNAVVSLPEVVNFADPETITIFFGALNREPDWQSLMPVINEVADLAGNRLKFQVVHDAQFYEALQTPHKSFTPTCDYETYQRLLAGSEISFMPLSDTPFNRSKSDLKFIEAASFRVAALASPVVYADSIIDGKTGVLFRDPNEFRLGLMRLIALPNLARTLADAARRYVTENRMMAYQIEPRIAWYHSLWDRREELEQARRLRLARHAGLAA